MQIVNSDSRESKKQLSRKKMNRNIPRNKPIATVIKNYVDKKSGKVSDSRKEIQRRFFVLDWKGQKRYWQPSLIQASRTEPRHIPGSLTSGMLLLSRRYRHYGKPTMRINVHGASSDTSLLNTWRRMAICSKKGGTTISSADVWQRMPTLWLTMIGWARPTTWWLCLMVTGTLPMLRQRKLFME